MGDNLTASTDVSARLQGIERRIDNQDDLLVGVNDSLKELVRVSERQIAQSERSEERYAEIHRTFDQINIRMDKQDARITKNHDTITKWVGVGIGFAVVFSVVGSIIAMYSQLK